MNVIDCTHFNVASIARRARRAAARADRAHRHSRRVREDLRTAGTAAAATGHRRQRHRARRDRVGRIHRTPSGRRLRRSPAARVRVRVRRPLLRGRDGPQGRPALPDRPASVPGRSRSTARRARLARSATVQRANSELQRAERLRSENAISNEEHDRRGSFAQESAAQVAAVEAALRAAELNLEFTQVTSPISGRVGRAIVTEGNLVSSGPGEATLLTTVVSLDPVYAYFDADEQIFLKYTAGGDKGAESQARSIAASAWRSPTRRASRARVSWTSSTTSSIARTGTIRGRAVFRNTDGRLTPGPVRPPAPRRHRHVPRRADSGPRRRHGPEQEVRLRRLAEDTRSSTAR